MVRRRDFCESREMNSGRTNQTRRLAGVGADRRGGEKSGEEIVRRYLAELLAVRLRTRELDRIRTAGPGNTSKDPRPNE
jgi:hypothetical protein